MSVVMRELRAKDTFKVIRLAKKLGITNSIVSLLKQQEKAKDLMEEQEALLTQKIAWDVIVKKSPGSKDGKAAQTEIEKAEKRLKELAGILNDESFEVITSLVEIVLENIDGVEDEVYKFLGDLCDMDEKEFSDISFVDFVGVLKDFFAKPELREVAKLFTPSNSSEEKTNSETDSTNVIPMQEA